MVMNVQPLYPNAAAPRPLTAHGAEGPHASAAIDWLRSTAGVRAQAQALLARARMGQSDGFTVSDAALDAVAMRVAQRIREHYPALQVPPYGCWRQFEAGGVDRRALLQASMHGADAATCARAQIDLCMVAVLLGAGTGAAWRWQEAASGQRFSRTEGLCVASFHAFMGGLFSSDPAQPCRVDAVALQRQDADTLGRALQVGPGNPLVGLDARAALLRHLGHALAAQPAVFGADGRPGGLLDRLSADGGQVQAHRLLRVLLQTLSGIWPNAHVLHGVPLGDCWPHPAALGHAAGWVPLHQRLQWLTYSLLEPLEWAGMHVGGLDALVGLPDERNAGLLLDAGVLRLRDLRWAQRLLQPGDALVVEWRALAVALLDELASRVRAALGAGADQMPLACVLQGGVWAEGRELAQALRGGTPALLMDSDGTLI